MTEAAQWRQFADAASEQYAAPTGDFAQLWQWSVDNPARFWRALWEHFGLDGRGKLASGDTAVLADPSMPGAQWFPGLELNYVDRILTYSDRGGPAIVGVDE